MANLLTDLIVEDQNLNDCKCNQKDKQFSIYERLLQNFCVKICTIIKNVKLLGFYTFKMSWMFYTYCNYNLCLVEKINDIERQESISTNMEKCETVSTNTVNKKQNLNSYENYEKLMANIEKQTKKKQINDNCFSNFLVLYGIKKTSYNDFLGAHYKEQSDYNSYLRKTLKGETKTNFFEYIFERETKMLKNTNDITHTIANGVGGYVNEPAMNKNKKNNKIAFESIGEKEYLKNGKVKIEGIDHFDVIRKCFFTLVNKKLELEKYKDIEESDVKKFISPCFNRNFTIDKKEKQLINKKVVHLILEAFHDICKFHNIAFIALYRTQDSSCEKNADVKGAYKETGEKLNNIYSNITKKINYCEP